MLTKSQIEQIDEMARYMREDCVCTKTPTGAHWRPKWIEVKPPAPEPEIMQGWGREIDLFLENIHELWNKPHPRPIDLKEIKF